MEFSKLQNLERAEIGLVKSAFVHFLHNHIILFVQPYWMYFPQAWKYVVGFRITFSPINMAESKAKPLRSTLCLSDIHYENDALVMNVNIRHLIWPSLCYPQILQNSLTKDAWVARIGGSSPDIGRQNSFLNKEFVHIYSTGMALSRDSWFTFSF